MQFESSPPTKITDIYITSFRRLMASVSLTFVRPFKLIHVSVIDNLSSLVVFYLLFIYLLTS